MSSPLAIASVTYVLKDLLNDGLINRNVSAATGGLVKVTALPPDLLLESTADKGSKLNLFMYQATPNQGWRNAGLPSRDSRGNRTANPPLALDLHYLLTAFSSEELHAEILLGYGMLLLHEHPVLTRTAIETALSGASASGSGLPERLKSLAASGLADQIEQVKITLQPMNSDELSKLWSAFQSKYRPTAAYQVSVVLLESTLPARAPLPVLRRGRPEEFAGGGEGIGVAANLLKPLPPTPTITGVTCPDQQQSACLGDAIVLDGFNLNGSDVVVCFESRWGNNEVAIGDVSGPLTVQLPAGEPEAWAAGVQSVSALVRRPGKTFCEATNKVPFALAPSITLPPDAKSCVPNDDRADLFDLEITIRTAPHLWPGQRVSLFLNDTEALAEPFIAQTDRARFVFTALPPGDYLVRMRVDGVDSHFIDYALKSPAFIAGAKVTVP